MIADGDDRIASGLQDPFGLKRFTRIMCWAHVHMNCQEYANKFIKEDKEKGEVLNDIDSLQVMPPPEDFEHAWIQFFEKWTENKYWMNEKFF